MIEVKEDVPPLEVSDTKACGDTVESAVVFAIGRRDIFGGRRLSVFPPDVARYGGTLLGQLRA